MKRVAWSSLAAFAIAGCAAAPPPAPPPPPPPPPPAVTVEAVATAEPPKPETPDADFRRQPPLLELAPAKARPMIVEEAKALSGVRVLVSPEHAMPIVSMQMLVRWSRDTPAGAGRAIASSLAKRGPGSIVSALEALGGTALVEAHPDALHIAVNLSATEVPRAVAVYARFLGNPTFAPADNVFGITGPGEATEEAVRHVFPTDHVYARFFAPGKTKSDDLLAHLKTLLKTDGVSFVLAGDARASDVAAMIDRELPTHKAQPLAEPRFDRPLPNGALIVDTDSVDAVVTFVALGPARSDPDFPAALITNELLRAAAAQVATRAGGVSRPTLTYEAERGESPWAISVPAPKERVGESVEALLAALRELAPTPAQISATTKPWLDWTETLLDRESDHAWSLARIAAQKEGDPARLHAALLALTPADVRRVIDKWLAKKQLRLVVRGPAKTVRASVDKAGFGIARAVK